jgi:hypothetical protein
LEHLEIILSHYEFTVKQLEGDGQVRDRVRGFRGSYGNIWEVLFGFEYLLGQLEQCKDNASEYPAPWYFKIGINLTWAKLDQYYRRADETPIYYAAIALYSGFK